MPAKDVSYQSCRWHAERVCLTKELSKLFVLAHLCIFRILFTDSAQKQHPAECRVAADALQIAMVRKTVAEQDNAGWERWHCCLLIAVVVGRRVCGAKGRALVRWCVRASWHLKWLLYADTKYKQRKNCVIVYLLCQIHIMHIHAHTHNRRYGVPLICSVISTAQVNQLNMFPRPMPVIWFCTL